MLLGIEFERSKDTTMLRQRGYIEDILSRYGMLNCKPVSTPLEVNAKLRKREGDPKEDDEKLLFRELAYVSRDSYEAWHCARGEPEPIQQLLRPYPLKQCEAYFALFKGH